MGKYFGLIHEKIGKNIGKFQHFFRQILAHVVEKFSYSELKIEKVKFFTQSSTKIF